VQKVKSEDLKKFGERVFKAVGLPSASAVIVSESLVASDLRGVESHGVCRIPVYVERIQLKAVNPHPRIDINRKFPCIATVDGDNGMGAVVGTRAMEVAVQLAGKAGMGIVSIRGGNHFGALAFYTKRAVRAGYIGLACTNAPPTMAPWGGRSPFFGTNPFSVAVPAGDRDPVVLDMSSSVVARGKIILASQKGDVIPEGWALDKQGKPTRDPQKALAGTVLPFGGYKGYGITLIIEVMAGILSGARFAPNVGGLYGGENTAQDIGAFMAALNPGAFGVPADVFSHRMSQIIDGIRSCETTDRIYLPGEIEQESENERLQRGITVPLEVAEELRCLAKKLAVDPHPF
jgi:LDH2 family malate/lactate/ureidoglycolate dehydrogenase